MDDLPTLSLLGGPLHRLGARAGLVRGGTHTVALGVALGLGSWLSVMLLATLEGVELQLLNRESLGGHVRLLVVIPMMFLCESHLAPRLAELVPSLVRSDILPERSLAALGETIARITRWKDHWLPDTACLVTAVAVAWIVPQLDLQRAGVAPLPGAPASLTGEWYWLVCLTLFRFLLFRWVWQLGLWCYFLWKVARLELDLVPTHPDGVAGLGYLEVVQTYFVPLIFALSMLEAAVFAEDFFRGTTAFEAIYPTFVSVLVLDAALFLGPALVFAPKLWAARVKGLSDYMELAARYTHSFDRKWVAADGPTREGLLGTPDLQSLADLSASVEVVRNMRPVPLSRRLIIDVAGAALIPLLPLFALRYPVAELLERLLTRLTGL